jgi:large subunit ribosomal protein L13
MAESYTREKVTLDASDQAVGRLASEIARILQGKHKPSYEPHEDNGDFVEVRNLAKIKVTGNKLEGKTYYRHTGYPGGLRRTAMKTVMAKDPSEVLRRAVRNMLPNNRLRNDRMKRLSVHQD